MPEWKNQMVLPCRQNILKMNPWWSENEHATSWSGRLPSILNWDTGVSLRTGGVRLAPVTFQNSIKKIFLIQLSFVVSFHLRFKNGWLTDFVIYWLLVSVVHQSFFGALVVVSVMFCFVDDFSAFVAATP